MTSFRLTTDAERTHGFTAADQIRALMYDLNATEILALYWERHDNPDSVYSHLGAALEAVFRQLGLTPPEAHAARMFTIYGPARAAYDRVIADRPCTICKGHGYTKTSDDTGTPGGTAPCPAGCPPF